MVVRRSMATGERNSRRSTKRSASGTPKPTNTTTDNPLQPATEWSNDHEFLSPNDIYNNAVGLLYCLVTKQLFEYSYTTIYNRRLKTNWINIFQKERKSLKSNSSSVTKCFMINRLIAECERDDRQFAIQTGELFNEIQKRMSTDDNTSAWTLNDFYRQVQSRQTLQCQRRLFYTKHEEGHQSCNLLTLQNVATRFFRQLITNFRHNPSDTNRHHLEQFFRSCFIIVQQPSIRECVAATKYEKLDNCNKAKLSVRIICLIDPNLIDIHLELPPVEVKLRPFDRQIDQEGENQLARPWGKRLIVDADHVTKYFYFIELEFIELKTLDIRGERPMYRAQLCHLEFNIKIRIKATNVEENVTLFSRLFGVCSHAQYYPEYVAKVILHEVMETQQANTSIVEPNILAGFINRYHTRVSGVEIKEPTSQYILNVLQTEYDTRRTPSNANSMTVYENIVARLVSQMELYIDHPFLSMMYHDGLFLGICDHEMDRELSGTHEHPHILIRSNTLLNHEAKQRPSVRFIVHDGQLTRASFHSKAFIDEMCQMICRANTKRARMMRVSFPPFNGSFHGFSLYFDKDLYRLNPALSSQTNVYQPLIPTLLNTMRIHSDEHEQAASTVDPALVSHEPLHIETPIEPEDEGPSRKIRRIDHDTSNDPLSAIVLQLVANFFDYLTTPSNPIPPTTTTSAPSIMIPGDIHQHKEILFHMIMDALPRTVVADDVTQAPPFSTDDFPWLIPGDEL